MMYKKKKNIYAVLLAGGKGTRLWPLSTEKFSKSFVSLGKRNPLLAETINRLRGLIPRKNTIIVIDKKQRGLLKKITKGIPKRNILVEPFGRSTASAIGLAAIELNPQDIMVVLPTDSLIKEKRPFQKTVRDTIGFLERKNDALLCIGIKPKTASTAYGYIRIKRKLEKEIYTVDKFLEKPKKARALRLIRSANYLWNAGIFIFRAGDILKAMKTHAPLLYRELKRIKNNKKIKLSAYKRMKNVSLDYQIMEKAKNLYCAKGKFSWTDLGSWVSLEGLLKKDRFGNVTLGKASLVDTHNSIVYNAEKRKLGVVGLKDTILVNTKNGTLACNKKDAEKVKILAETL